MKNKRLFDQAHSYKTEQGAEKNVIAALDALPENCVRPRYVIGINTEGRFFGLVFVDNANTNLSFHYFIERNIATHLV